MRKVGRRFEDPVTGMVVEVRAAVPSEATEGDLARIFANVAAVMTHSCDVRAVAADAMRRMATNAEGCDGTWGR